MTPLDALQTTLAAEHAAIHVLSALAGTARGLTTPPGDDTPAAIAARHDVHRGRREHLRVLLRNAGADPVAGLPAYTLPARDTLADLRRGVLEVEEACLTTYTALVASSTDDARAWGIDALLESAQDVLDWGTTPTPFPGAEDLLDL